MTGRWTRNKAIWALHLAAMILITATCVGLLAWIGIVP